MANTVLTILLLPLLAFVLIVFVTGRQKALSAGVSIVALAVAAALNIQKAHRPPKRAWIGASENS